MIPAAPKALQMLAQRLMTQLVPDAKSTYSMSDGMMLGVLLTSLESEMEAGIDRRLQDVRAMKSLFEAARGRLGKSAMPADVDEVLALQPASMTMTDVNVVHDAHTRALIALHERVDTAAADQPEHTVNLAIWRYLDEHARRHALNL